MWTEQLQLWVGTWEGVYLGEQATWLRFYDANGVLIPIPSEAERARAEAAEAEVARLKARLQALARIGNS